MKFISILFLAVMLIASASAFRITTDTDTSLMTWDRLKHKLCTLNNIFSYLLHCNNHLLTLLIDNRLQLEDKRFDLCYNNPTVINTFPEPANREGYCNYILQ